MMRNNVYELCKLFMTRQAEKGKLGRINERNEGNEKEM